MQDRKKKKESRIETQSAVYLVSTTVSDNIYITTVCGDEAVMLSTAPAGRKASEANAGADE
jgi:hypothetical protein